MQCLGTRPRSLNQRSISAVPICWSAMLLLIKFLQQPDDNYVIPGFESFDPERFLRRRWI